MTGQPFDAIAFTRAAQALRANNIDNLAAFYAQDCEFTDPFQTVHGREAVTELYRAMFQGLSNPRFLNVETREIAVPAGYSHQELAVRWDFEFAFRPTGGRRTIAGLSLLTLGQDGLIARHVDYWDASQLMQELPLIGRLIHWVRRKIAQAA